MHTDDPVLELMDRFTAALNSGNLDAVMALVTDDIVFESTSPPPDGARYDGRDAVRQVWGQMLATTRLARFSVEEQFSDGSERAVVRWRYDWGDGHVRGVDIVRVRNGQLAESLAYVKGLCVPRRPEAWPATAQGRSDTAMATLTGQHNGRATEQPPIRPGRTTAGPRRSTVWRGLRSFPQVTVEVGCCPVLAFRRAQPDAGQHHNRTARRASGRAGEGRRPCTPGWSGSRWAPGGEP
jgi:ketosteroid isomerase-like protein